MVGQQSRSCAAAARRSSANSSAGPMDRIGEIAEPPVQGVAHQVGVDVAAVPRKRRRRDGVPARPPALGERVGQGAFARSVQPFQSDQPAHDEHPTAGQVKASPHWYGTVTGQRSFAGGTLTDVTTIKKTPGEKTFLGSTPATGNAVLGRDVGEILLLRHAGHPADLLVLLGGRRRPRPGRGGRDQHRRRLRRAGVPVHDPRCLAGRPDHRRGTHPVHRRRAGHVRAHRAVADAGPDRRRRRTGADRLRQRRGEGECHVAGGHALFAGGSTPGRGLLHLLLRDQPRRLPRPTAHRAPAEQHRLPLGLRPGSCRDGHRPGYLHGRAEEPATELERGPESAPGQPACPGDRGGGRR